MKCVYVLVVYVGSNGIGDGLTCPHWLILMIKRMGITKGNVINCLCVLCWERIEGLLNHVDVTLCLCGCELCDVMKMVISSLYVWTCHLHYSEALVVPSVMCIEKAWVLKRLYHFEGRIARRDEYYISEGHIARHDGYYYRGSCRAPREMHGQIFPPWVPEWKTTGVYH